MNVKAHHHVAIASLIMLGISGVWLWGSLVFAQDSVISVTIGAPDACANIAGYQSSVPPGMVVDAFDNCSTPIPPPVDVCANLAGVQETIPNGYYRDGNGDCLIQPAPPVDVCPNLPGTQPIVPVGYTNNVDGDCIIDQPDLCLNINGPQPVIPEGMERNDDGECSTPLVITPPGPTATDPDPFVAPTVPRSSNTLANIPQFAEAAFVPIVDAIPESIKEAVRSLPPVVAQTFPYYIFVVLLLGAAIMTFQAFQEAAAIGALIGILKRERDIADQKDNFIALASHYLRTPLTLMKSGLDTIVAVKELPEEQVASLREPIVTLDEKIGSILSDIEENRALQGIAAPEQDTTPPHFLRSGFFWIPVATAIFIIGLSNFFLGVVGNVQIGAFNLWMQSLLLVAVAFFLYTAIRNRFIRRRNRAFEEQNIGHQRTVDEARNRFISEATEALQIGLAGINAHRQDIAGAHSAKFFNDGYDRFATILQKFSLLASIRAGREVPMETFDVHSAVDGAIARLQPQITEHELTIVNNVPTVNVTQHRELFDFVLGSLIDNAVKFSHNGGTIQIGADPHHQRISLKFSDYGVGIAEEKLSQLFMPFSRGTSAMEFNYEGLGFSLFLDKIIMDYIGGDISASSEPEKGSTFTVTAATQPAMA